MVFRTKCWIRRYDGILVHQLFSKFCNYSCVLLLENDCIVISLSSFLRHFNGFFKYQMIAFLSHQFMFLSLCFLLLVQGSHLLDTKILTVKNVIVQMMMCMSVCFLVQAKSLENLLFLGLIIRRLRNAFLLVWRGVNTWLMWLFHNYGVDNTCCPLYLIFNILFMVHISLFILIWLTFVCINTDCSTSIW